MSADTALAHLAGLSQRVDEKFAEIHSRYPQAFRCAEGCHSCCKPGLTVSRLEAARIQEGLATDPARSAALLATEAADPFQGKRCSFLQAGGGCGIYELRPLVCRSHGAPLQFASPDGSEMRLRDVCPLNFTGEDLATLPADAILNLDTLNTLLAVLNKQAFGKDRTRVALKPSALLAEPAASRG